MYHFKNDFTLVSFLVQESFPASGCGVVLNVKKYLAQRRCEKQNLCASASPREAKEARLCYESTSRCGKEMRDPTASGYPCLWGVDG